MLWESAKPFGCRSGWTIWRPIGRCVTFCSTSLSSPVKRLALSIVRWFQSVQYIHCSKIVIENGCGTWPPNKTVCLFLPSISANLKHKKVRNNLAVWCRPVEVVDILMLYSLYVIQVSISPPDSVCDVIHSQTIRPAKLVTDNHCAVASVHTNTTNVRRQTPFSPKCIPVEEGNNIQEFTNYWIIKLLSQFDMKHMFYIYTYNGHKFSHMPFQLHVNVTCILY